MVDVTKTSAFIEKVQKLAKNHDRLVFTGGTSNKQNIMLELYKEASLLMTFVGDDSAFVNQSGVVEGKLRIAQVTNTIGTEDFNDLQDELYELTKGMA